MFRRTDYFTYCLLITFALASCAPSSATAYPTYDPFAPVTEQTFTSGLSEIPANKIVFLELLITIDCSCGCAVLEQPWLFYSYTSNTLKIRVLNDESLEASTDIVDLLSNTSVLLGTEGLYGGQYYLTDLRSFKALPFEFEIDENNFSIYSADGHGAIVAKTPDGIYIIEPGQTWYSQPYNDIEQPSNADSCHAEYIYGLANHGLIEKIDIQYSDKLFPND